MSNWQEKFSFVSPEAVQHKVPGWNGDSDLNFYPVSVSMAFRLRKIAKPIATALSVVFGDEKDRAYGTIFREIEGGRENIIEAMSVEMAQFRHEKRSDAYEQLAEALTGEDTKAVIGDILIDSLRDKFPRTDSSNPSGAELMDDLHMTLPAVAAMVHGVYKANKESFGPLAQALESRIEGLKGEESESEPEKNPTDGES